MSNKMSIDKQMTAGKKNQKDGKNFVIFTGHEIPCKKLSSEKMPAFSIKTGLKTLFFKEKERLARLLLYIRSDKNPIPLWIGNGKTTQS